MDDLDLPITEEWLKEVGFRWHQLDRQPNKHWLLWLGYAIPGKMTCYEDIGIEVASGHSFEDGWFCWLRADTAGRYHRFIHLRHLHDCKSLVRIIEGITGQDWNPANNLYGSMLSPDEAERARADMDRLDNEFRAGSHKWAKIEEDDTRGRALPEHMQAHEDARQAKQEAENDG